MHSARGSPPGSDDDRENWNSTDPSAHLVHFKASPRKNTTKRLDLRAASTDTEDGFVSGLLTPPSSQLLEATRTLISPPPEEVLRVANIRAGSQNSHYREFTPSLLASNRPDTTQMPKRKRSGVLMSTINSSEPLTEHDTDIPNLQGNPTHSTIIASGNVYTPNPKPRKQSKHHLRNASIQSVDSIMHSPTAISFPASLHESPSKVSMKSAFRRASKSPSKHVLIQSPHLTNPQADYIPPVPSPTRKHISFRNRSSTPIIPYEPPTERFTPPREITLSPVGYHTPKMPKSSRRKSTRPKSEPPELDLDRPVPPPSPTDDPLLLSGPTRGPHKPVRSRFTPSIASSSYDSQDEDDEQPSFSARLSLTERDDFSTDDTDMQLPIFDDLPAVPPSDGGWSESDEEEDGFDQSGEYTGKFRMVKIPTKEDPPTSGTRDRMDSWGRPLSPFPYSQHLDSSLPLADSEDDEIDAFAPLSSPTMFKNRVADETVQGTHISEDEIMGGSSPEYGQETSLPNEESHSPVADIDAYDPSPPRHTLSPCLSDIIGTMDTTQVLDTEEPELGPDVSVDSTEATETPEESLDSIDAPAESTDVPRADLSEDEEEAEEELIDRQLSLEPAVELHARETLVTPRRISEQSPQNKDELAALAGNSAEDDASSDGEDNSVDGDVVRITSADPRAAARAAAILKLHDYDCLSEDSFQHKRLARSSLSSISRKTRRKTLFDAGITKSSDSPSTRLRRRTFGGVVGDKVFIPGSPITTLPALLQEAEGTIHQFTPNKPAQTESYKAPISSINAALNEVSESIDPSNRKWTKEDWKYLDACFTEERLSVGAQLGQDEGSLSGVDEVVVEDVVDRFVLLKGGIDIVDNFGPLWTRDNLLRRVKALQRKQRSGNVAPPTPDYRRSSSSREISEVPDFTPLSRRITSKPKLPPPLSANPFDSITLTGLKPAKPIVAPQYSYLLDQAKAIEGGVVDEQVVPAKRVTEPREQPRAEAASSKVPRLKQPAPSVGKRMKGFLFSYLPTLSKDSSAKLPKDTSSARPGLPLPPPELFEKPRKPISTPARPPINRPKHPKELVQLQHPPSIQKSSIPRVAEPRRMVQLHPLPSNPSDQSTSRPRPRTSSGASVKDLVKCFEDFDDKRSHGTIGKRNGAAKSRPTWKP
ncbi:hypothetical protein SERLA73DRAFT_79466 [Serpula lacrymans var. lacrymans S7.3]|uniref:Uncharacterized protein n=2 Tax=Serpula lacrymans var. lacrymans TaxID=341189 RepID=F8QGI4_SERL3|nr:uncharacterized protein SERLADRAFT_433283 [Serpula lacrymans var. lacrymans S7.9]EGN92530.1 hypothetical protein SERLA73DRAFT_79466 [Serpula lacrymans var. lacrymans S7.3]EGO29277.1 hypothetical protein SERLADRAFT_433283 [Serpula lacrymans var. lacrymans S7.9]